MSPRTLLLPLDVLGNPLQLAYLDENNWGLTREAAFRDCVASFSYDVLPPDVHLPSSTSYAQLEEDNFFAIM